MARLYLGRVGAASAKAYGVDAEAWRKELVDATLVDPVQMHRTALKLAERLRKGTDLEIRHSNGTALHLRLRHREPKVDSGILPIRSRNGKSRLKGHPGLLDVNLPAGSVIVAVDEEAGDGRFVASEPTDSAQGPLVGGVWDVRNGKLVSHTYRSGGEIFDREFQAAGVHLGTPGAVLVGVNPKIRSAPLMRDQHLGAVTFTLGGNRFWGGNTDGHGFHPYLTLYDAELLIDGKAVVQPAG
jgi:hypothetical protein